MSQDTFRLGLVGAGIIARTHIRAMGLLKERGLGGFELAAICDMNAEAAAEAAALADELLGERPLIYADYRDMLDEETLDGADLCLPRMHMAQWSSQVPRNLDSARVGSRIAASV